MAGDGREPGTGSRQPGTANGEGEGGDWRSELRGALIGLVIAAVILGGGWLAGSREPGTGEPGTGNRETATTYGNDDGLWRGGKALMADWVVSGAGDASYNGDYSEAGTYNSKPYYVGPSPANNRYLFWEFGWWILDSELGEFLPDYGGTGADLPANPWLVGDGTPPAPTVSAAEEEWDWEDWWARWEAYVGRLMVGMEIDGTGANCVRVSGTIQVAGEAPLEILVAAYTPDTYELLGTARTELEPGEHEETLLILPEGLSGDALIMLWPESLDLLLGAGEGEPETTEGVYAANVEDWPGPPDDPCAPEAVTLPFELAPVVAGTAALSDARLVAVAGDADLSDARLVRVGGGAALSDDRNLVGDTLYGQFPLSDARLVRVANSSALSDARLVRVSGGAALSDARPTHRLGGRWRLSDDRQVAVSGSALLSDARTVGVSGRARMSDARLVAVSGGALLSDDREAPPGGTSSLATMLLLMARRRR